MTYRDLHHYDAYRDALSELEYHERDTAFAHEWLEGRPEEPRVPPMDPDEREAQR